MDILSYVHIYYTLGRHTLFLLLFLLSSPSRAQSSSALSDPFNPRLVAIHPLHHNHLESCFDSIYPSSRNTFPPMPPPRPPPASSPGYSDSQPAAGSAAQGGQRRMSMFKQRNQGARKSGGFKAPKIVSRRRVVQELGAKQHPKL